MHLEPGHSGRSRSPVFLFFRSRTRISGKWLRQAPESILPSMKANKKWKLIEMKKTTISGPELILPSMKANKEMKAYRNESL